MKERKREKPGPIHFGSGTFWLIAISYVGINMPASGILSQMVPMMLEEGLTSTQAAFGISAFAAGQFFGRLACGWFLDRVHPQRTGFFFTLIPAIGCVLLWQTQNYSAAALFAVAAIGVQQGAEIDLIAYFVARRFGIERYGAIYGWIQVAGLMERCAAFCCSARFTTGPATIRFSMPVLSSPMSSPQSHSSLCG